MVGVDRSHYAIARPKRTNRLSIFEGVAAWEPRVLTTLEPVTMPTTEQTCKLHPDRPAGIVCQRCESLMCTQCMHQAPVGWHCPTCVRTAAKEQAPAVKAMRRAMGGHQPIVTSLIIAACVALFAWDVQQGAALTSGLNSRAGSDFSLFAPSLKFDGEWYRIVTSAFTHSGLMHIGFNMWILWQMGQMVEGRFGSLTFGSIYVTGLLGGALGALLLEPTHAVVGASGAVFALLGAIATLQQMAGVNVMQTGLGRLLILNIGITFFVPSISKGGHFGGLAAGILCGLLLGYARKRGAKFESLAPIGIALLGFILLVAILPVTEMAIDRF